MPCTIAIARQSVCWRLKTLVNLITATFFFSMAASWLSLAHQDETIDNLLASWDMAAPGKTDGLGA
jgi:hypothetical protein